MSRAPSGVVASASFRFGFIITRRRHGVGLKVTANVWPVPAYINPQRLRPESWFGVAWSHSFFWPDGDRGLERQPIPCEITRRGVGHLPKSRHEGCHAIGKRKIVEQGLGDGRRLLKEAAQKITPSVLLKRYV